MRRAGFTLLEILIATGIFMTVMVVAIGIFSTTIAGSSTSEQIRVTAQVGRSIYESIIRDIRSGRGLVVLRANGTHQTIIAPFTVDDSDASQPVLTIHQVKKVGLDSNTGQNKYQVTRRTYRTVLASKQITLTTEVTDPDGLTAANLVAGFTANLSGFWRAANPIATQQTVDLVPSGLRLQGLSINRFQSYTDNPDDQKNQPFIELSVTIANKKYNPASRDGSSAKTTLRTTIVPRDFVGPFEVAQEGVEGVVDVIN